MGEIMLKPTHIVLFLAGLLLTISLALAYTPSTYTAVNLTLGTDYTPPAYTQVNLTLGEQDWTMNGIVDCSQNLTSSTNVNLNVPLNLSGSGNFTILNGTVNATQLINQNPSGCAIYILNGVGTFRTG